MPDPTHTGARRGHDQVNLTLDLLVSLTRAVSPACLAADIAARGIIGHADSTNSSPVGMWVVAQLADLHAQGALADVAVSFSWRGWLAVYDPALRVIGEITIPTTHPLYQLECQVSDLDRPDLAWQGMGDPR